MKKRSENFEKLMTGKVLNDQVNDQLLITQEGQYLRIDEALEKEFEEFIKEHKSDQNNRIQFSLNLKRFAEKKKITRINIATKIFRSKYTVDKYFAGDIMPDELGIYLTLAAIFKVTIQDLLESNEVDDTIAKVKEFVETEEDETRKYEHIRKIGEIINNEEKITDPIKNNIEINDILEIKEHLSKISESINNKENIINPVKTNIETNNIITVKQPYIDIYAIMGLVLTVVLNILYPSYGMKIVAIFSLGMIGMVRAKILKNKSKAVFIQYFKTAIIIGGLIIMSDFFVVLLN